MLFSLAISASICDPSGSKWKISKSDTVRGVAHGSLGSAQYSLSCGVYPNRVAGKPRSAAMATKGDTRRLGTRGNAGSAIWPKTNGAAVATEKLDCVCMSDIEKV